jgi:hypothetical protein
MSQIQEIVTLVLVSILLGASTATANADDYISGDDNALTPNVTVSREANLVSLRQDRATVSDDTYSFTMTLPERSDNRFAKLSFSFTKPDRDRTIVPVNLNLSATAAFIGTSNAGEAIAVKDTWIDETGTVWIEFNSPLATKTTLTVVFKTQQPLAVGQYAYSIAAYSKLSAPIFVDDGTLTTAQ